MILAKKSLKINSHSYDLEDRYKSETDHKNASLDLCMESYVEYDSDDCKHEGFTFNLNKKEESSLTPIGIFWDIENVQVNIVTETLFSIQWFID